MRVHEGAGEGGRVGKGRILQERTGKGKEKQCVEGKRRKEWGKACRVEKNEGAGKGGRVGKGRTGKGSAGKGTGGKNRSGVSKKSRKVGQCKERQGRNRMAGR